MESTWLCEYCGAPLKTETKLRLHKQRHHKNPDYTCHLCSLSFIDKKCLRRHINQHLVPPKYELLDEVKTYVRKFKISGKRLTFKVTDPPTDVAEIDWARDAIFDLVKYLKKDCKPTDQIGFTFKSENLEEKPGWLKFRPVSELKPEAVWDLIFSLFQSSTGGGVNARDTFRLHVTTVEMPVGSAPRRGLYYNNFDEECTKRRGIIVIDNRDNLCLPRALVVGKAHVDKDLQYNKIRYSESKLQKEKANALMEVANVVVPEEGCGIPELKRFQEYLSDYCIRVYDYASRGRHTMFGENNNGKPKINLLFHNRHYNVITSLTSAFGCRYYCEDCLTPFSDKGKHRCEKQCKACRATPPCVRSETRIRCDDCHRQFFDENCLRNHKITKICESVKMCEKCLKVYNLNILKTCKRPHVCGEIFCKTCYDYRPPEHLCFIKKDNRKPPEDNYLFVFFDLESRQETPHPEKPELMLHEPNLCVSQQLCYLCKDNNSECEKCGRKQNIFQGRAAISGFMEMLLEVRKKFKTVCCLSHNGQAYDNQFIFKYLLEKTQFTPQNLIMRGTKLIQMQIDNVRFIDSLNYFPMALAKLPKAFSLTSTLKKGFFPHLFNRIDKESYIGPIPDMKYYCPDSMSTKARSEFVSWYEEQVAGNFIFDMQKEITEYCISDVNILREACMQFRAYFLKECHVDPFLEACTIASACNLVFRRRHLAEDTIGLIPPGGYRMRDNQSKIALEWLISLEKEENIVIQHAGRSREAVLSGLKVDGYHPETNRVFEFQGCYFHGCPNCFPFHREEKLHDDPTDTMSMRHERTLEKIAKLRGEGYDVVEIWECEFRREKKNMAVQVPEDHPMLNTTPLDARDAFYGGRTGCTKLFYNASDEEKIEYVDVCSLYPWVCKYGKYPIGHPKIHIGDACDKLDLKTVEGLIKCSVLPPVDLYHPVLPVKQNGKLIFTLCNTCSNQQNTEECLHDDSQRIISGVWVIDEVKKALSKGYKIVKIYEIWEYEVTKFDRETKNGGLFTHFIDQFLKMKQEASGFPSDCSSIEQKEGYINEYLHTEGVKLDIDSIDVNPGLRSLAKLMLNSFWGRFGMRENMPKTTIVNEPSELFNLLADPSTEVNGIQEVNENVCIVNWQHREEAQEFSRTVNVVIAAYTTAQARLKLYEHLEALDKQVLYYDTDSVIYSYTEGQHRVVTGNFLGEMTDELECYGQGSHITEFVSGGPKTYAYKVFTPPSTVNYTCKVKGLTLNFQASQIVNFDCLKKMVTDKDDDNQVIVHSTNILRTRERDIVTAPASKIFRINVTKRRIVENYDTLPYGYKRLCTDKQ